MQSTILHSVEDVQASGSISTGSIQAQASSSVGAYNPTNDRVRIDARHPPPRSQVLYDQERFERILDRDAITPVEPLSNTAFELASLENQTGKVISSSIRNTGSTHELPLLPTSQGIPAELPNLLAEIIFILTCTGGRLVSALLIGHVAVTQAAFGDALGILPSQLPWLLGSSSLAAGLSVIISGSLADLTPPKPLMVGGFVKGDKIYQLCLELNRRVDALDRVLNGAIADD